MSVMASTKRNAGFPLPSSGGKQHAWLRDVIVCADRSPCHHTAAPAAALFGAAAKTRADATSTPLPCAARPAPLLDTPDPPESVTRSLADPGQARLLPYIRAYDD